MAALLEQVRLIEERNRLCNDLSGGMKRRLGITNALIGNPKLLVVDEPTAGLDPEERLRFRNLLSELGGGEVTIILSTHIVGDISGACADMAILDNGVIGFRGTPSELIEHTRGHVWSVMVKGEMEARKIGSYYQVASMMHAGNEWELQVVTDRLERIRGNAGRTESRTCGALLSGTRV